MGIKALWAATLAAVALSISAQVGASVDNFTLRTGTALASTGTPNSTGGWPVIVTQDPNDPNTYCGDPSPIDLTVLNNDITHYEAEYTVNAPPGVDETNIRFTLTLPTGPGGTFLGRWTALPGQCQVQDVDQQVVTCILPDVPANTSKNAKLVLGVQVLAALADGTPLPSPTGQMQSSQTPSRLVVPSATATVTACAPPTNVFKSGDDYSLGRPYAQINNPQGIRENASIQLTTGFASGSGPNGEDGIFIQFPFAIYYQLDPSVGTQPRGFGGLSGTHFTFSDALQGNTYGARLVTWGTAAPYNCFTPIYNAYYYPASPIDLGTPALSPGNQEGFYGGTCTATQTGDVGQISVALDNPVLQPPNYPNNPYYTSNQRVYIATKTLYLWMPAIPGTVVGGNPDSPVQGNNQVSNCLKPDASLGGIAFGDPSDPLSTNPDVTDNCNYRNVNISASAFSSKYLYGGSFVYDPSINQYVTQVGSPYSDYIYTYNNGTVPLDSTMCDIVDNTRHTVLGARMQAGGTFASGYGIQFGVRTGGQVYWNDTQPVYTSGDMTSADCRDAAQFTWYDTVSDVQAARPEGSAAIAAVRATTLAPGGTQIQPGQYAYFIIDFRANSSYAFGPNQGQPIPDSCDQIPDYGHGYTSSGSTVVSDSLAGFNLRVCPIVNTPYLYSYKYSQPVPTDPAQQYYAGTDVTYYINTTYYTQFTQADHRLVITDDLPADLTYVPGFGTFGGQPLEPTVQVDTPTPGRTRLVWTFDPTLPGTQQSANYPQISFRAHISLLTAEGTQETNSLSAASYLGSSTTADASTISSSVFTAHNLIQLVMEKLAPAKVLPNVPFDYQMRVGGIGQAATDPDFIDILPFNGDGNPPLSRDPASVFSGTLRLSAPVQPLSPPVTNLVVYYTSASPATLQPDPNDPSNTTAGGVVTTIWCTEAAFGTAGCPNTISDATAVRLRALGGTLDLNQAYSTTLSILPAGNAVGDTYSNTIAGRSTTYVGLLRSSSATTQVDLGSLAGIFYFDGDADGIYNVAAGDLPLPGQTIALGGISFGADGIQGTPDDQSVNATTVTLADGSYEFIGLFPGNYTLTTALPATFSPGTSTIGSVGGTQAGNYQTTNIGLGTGQHGTLYNFSARRSPGVTDFGITKTVDRNTYTPGVATDVVYTIVVTNNGPESVVGASLLDPEVTSVSFTGWTCDITAPGALDVVSSCSAATGAGDVDVTLDLGAGGVATIVVQATIAADAIGDVVNSVIEQLPIWANQDPANNDPDSATATVSASIADLGISKTVTPSVYQPGTSSAATYTVVVTNYGPADVASASVLDSAPTGITFGAWSCAITTPGTGTLASACDVAGGSGNVATTVTLAAGGAATYTIAAQIAASASGNLVNTATETLPAGVQQNPSSNNADTASATIGANAAPDQADLGITKAVSPSSYVPGTASTVTYTVVVTNYGASDVSGASVADTAPAGVTFGAWSCAITTPGSGTVASACGAATGNGDVATTVTLAAGGAATYTITAQIAASASGNLINTASEALPPGVNQDPAQNNPDIARATLTVSGVVNPPVPAPALGWLALLALTALLGSFGVLQRQRPRR
ncbi:MAG: hypothetical protein ABI843_03510 [Dokdonella sp.]